MVGDPRGPTPRGAHIKAITHTTHNIDHNGYKTITVADVPLKQKKKLYFFSFIDFKAPKEGEPALKRPKKKKKNFGTNPGGDLADFWGKISGSKQGSGLVLDPFDTTSQYTQRRFE